jgi:hypothetical protein
VSVPSTPDLSTLERLPCGCLLGKDGVFLIYILCSKSCTYYLYLQSEAIALEKPVIKIGDEDDLPD